MMTKRRLRGLSALAGAALLLALPAHAQNAEWSPDSYRSGAYAAPRNDAPPSNAGYGMAGSDAANTGSYGADAYSPGGGGQGYGGNDDAPSRSAAPANDAYSPGGGQGYGNNDYAPSHSASRANDAYSPSRDGGSGAGDSYAPPRDSGGGYGEPYAPPGEEASRDAPPPSSRGTYDQNEIIAAGHGFFGAISQGLGKAVEYVFQSQGRPNGYILGEDAGGAFVVGLRYGEGMLYTKDAGDHKVFWQGPSLGYDAGAEGSKAMVLVYNLHDPSDIYHRFGGVQGAAYFIGGLSVQFQTYGPVTLAVIRSGVGVRLGANVGYLKYTRSPTWNPL